MADSDPYGVRRALRHWRGIGRCVACGALSVAADLGSARAQPRPIEQPDAGAPSIGASGAAEVGSITPPEALIRVDALYPPEALHQRREGTVTLLVTVETDGSVSDARVAASAGEDLDQAALTAIRQWRFRPALAGERPVRVRIRVPFVFTLPAPPALEPAPLADEPAPTAAPPAPGQEALPRGPSELPPVEVEVRGERALRTEQRSASDFVLKRQVLNAGPHQEGAEVLTTAPGVYMARAEGLAVGHRYMLRGFDADHGQDLELVVGGLPVNLPSHIHGQGYADLGFLIGETVQELRATEGVYDPRQGDFAVAGTIDLRLGVERRGWRLQTSHGSFDTHRQLLLWAPPELDEATFGAVQYRQTAGFGQNRQGQSASAILQWGNTSGAWRYRMLGVLYGARSDLAGVVRADDVAAGRVGFYSVYPHAAARAQNALAARVLTGVFAEYRGERGDTADLGVWLGLDNFRIQENFTGFIQHSQTLPNVAGRGDLIEQRNRTRSVGLSGRYRSAPYRPVGWARGTVELGLSGRMDEIAQAQNLIDAVVRSQTWDQRIDANIFGADIGFWADLDWRLARYLALRLGMRADVLAYEVDDRLGNRVTLTRPDDTFIVGFRRSALGVAWGPRSSAELTPLHWLSIRAAYGEGYRSPQARSLEDGEDAPFSKVRSMDLGVRLGDPESYQLTLSGYYTRLSDDVAFDAEEGRLESIGATRRLGAVAHAEVHPTPWLVAAVSATFVDAELLEPPPATAEEPQPPFEVGQNLAFVPPLVVRLDLGARPRLAADVGGQELSGRAGLGYSYLSERPLPFGEFSDSVSLLDASAGLVWGPLELGIDVYNLSNQRYAAAELNMPSSWDPNGVRSRTPARHTAAGAPRSWLLTFGVSL